MKMLLMNLISFVRNPSGRLPSMRAQSVLKGAMSNAGSRAISAFVGFINVPLGLHYLGAERYGLWATIITTTSWIALLELGISNTLTNSISIAFASGDEETAAEHTTNALAITLSIAAALALVVLFAWHTIDWMRVFSISNHVSGTEVQRTMAFALALVLITPVSTIVSKILAGYQQSHVYSAIAVIGSLGSLAGMVVGVRLRFTMPTLFLCAAGFSLLAGLLALLWTIYASKPWLKPRWNHLSLPTAKGLLASGSSFFFIQIAAIVVFNTDNLVVGHYLGATEVTPYSISMKLVGYAQLLPAFIYPSLWPAYAEADARHDIPWIRRTFRRTMTGSCALLFVSLVLVILFGRTVIMHWAGPTAVPAESLLILMAVWTFISAMTGVQGCLLGAVGKVRLQGILSCVAAVLNLGLSIVLVQRIGPAGAVLGTILSYVLVLVFPQTWEVRGYFRQAESRAKVQAQA